jgi:hypothetical protein
MAWTPSRYMSMRCSKARRSCSSTTSSPPAAPQRAAIRLLQGIGADVVGFAVFIELAFLNGSDHRWSATTCPGQVPLKRRSTLADVHQSLPRPLSGGDTSVLERAHEVAEEAHRGQVRKTGEPYITHPVAVAHMLALYGLDLPTVTAACFTTLSRTPRSPWSRSGSTSGRRWPVSSTGSPSSTGSDSPIGSRPRRPPSGRWWWPWPRTSGC